MRTRTVTPYLKRSLNIMVLLISAAVTPNAPAGTVYQFLQNQAEAGASITLQGIVFNDSGSALRIDTPNTLALQWRGAQAQLQTAIFTLSSSGNSIDLPVNNFVKLEWTGTAPITAHGLQSVTVADSPTKLAITVTPTLVTVPAIPPSSDSNSESQAPATQRVAATAQGSPFENFRNAISGYEPIYFVAGGHDGANARFQLSLKYRLHSPQDPAQPGFFDNFYVGYTQTSLWDLHSDSLPFVDTTYNPSVFWNKDAIWQTADQKWFIGLNAGLEHRSNGKEGDDSRSLNDFYLQPALNYRLDGGSTLSFMPRVKAYVQTQRDMHYPDYLGYVDWKARWAQDNGLAVSGLYRQGTAGRNATQLDISWPLRRTFLNMNGYLYLQFFQGYGETLLGYKERSASQVRLGIAFVP
ncbi:phospholipase A [Alcaligenaceae bacterium CGII-47]|nr:phospholipase A [Alcaligenaceae bacterium CGII-47]